MASRCTSLVSPSLGSPSAPEEMLPKNRMRQTSRMSTYSVRARLRLAEEGSELGTQLKLSCEYYGRTEPLALLEAAWAAAR